MAKRVTPPWNRSSGIWVPLAALVLVSAGLRSWAANKVPGPWFTPDEMIYAELGRSLYEHGHFEILGASPGFFGLVYPAFVGLPLHAFGTGHGYSLLKPVQALAASLTAVPVYLWARSLMPVRWAFVAAALSLCLPGLVLAGFLMNEVLFLPILCFAGWAMARVLIRPTLGRQALLLGALAVAVLTRLEALAMVPACFAAAGLEAALARAGLRRLRRLAPSFAGLLVAALAWVVVAYARGGTPLGAYRVVGNAHYDVAEASRFTLYHAADLILLTGVAPVIAVVLLSAAAFRSDPGIELRAYLSVTIALTLFLLVEVGAFASTFTGRLAERNLFVLGPLFFIGLCCWLARSEPGSRFSFVVASAAVLAMLLVAPWHRLITAAGEPDSFTLVPFVELRDHLTGVSPALFVAAVGALMIALMAWATRRPTAIAVGVGVALVGASLAAGRFAADQARIYQGVMVGQQMRWVDLSGAGPVVYLYGGELAWSRGAPAWSNLFWNRRISGVDELFGTTVEGPVPHRHTVVAADGRVLVGGREQRQYAWAVASTRLGLVGKPVAYSTAALTLWRVAPPLRLSSAKDGFDPATAELSYRASVTIWSCRGGTLALAFTGGDRPATVKIDAGRTRPTLVRLGPGERWSGTVPLPDEQARRPCTVRLSGGVGVRGDVEGVRSPPAASS